MIRPRFLTGFALAGALLCWLVAAPSAAPLHPRGVQPTPTMQPPPPPPPPAPPTTRAGRPAPPPPPPPPPVESVKAPGQIVNVQIELTIREDGAEGALSGKTVMLIAADHRGTQIRSSAQTGFARFNVDATPAIVPGNRVRLNLGIECTLASGPGAAPADAHGPEATWYLNQRMNLILQSGKPLVVSRTADPRSDRQAVVQVTATIVK